MKNLFLIIPVCLFCLNSNAQTIKELDTIFANEQKNVALFFPNPIRQGITGNENFEFNYNREKEQYFGLLQAKKGNSSNLLIINANGSVFSYIVSYKKELDKLNYFIADSTSIGFEKPLIVVKKDSIDSLTIETNKVNYYQRFCSYILGQKPNLSKIRKRKNRISLGLEKIIFDKEELYFVIDVDNKSSLDYDINFVEISVQTRKQGKKKSIQRIAQIPNYTYNVPTKVSRNGMNRMVFVLPKFSLADDKMVIIELNEKSGERNLIMKISNRYINNPN